MRADGERQVTALSSILWCPRRRWCRPVYVAVQLRVRLLLELIELFLLVVVQDLADLFVGLLVTGGPMS